MPGDFKLAIHMLVSCKYFASLQAMTTNLFRSFMRILFTVLFSVQSKAIISSNDTSLDIYPEMKIVKHLFLVLLHCTFSQVSVG